ncbi:MAG: hypothetical protein ABW201_08095 [Candidatus Thiodiazotropha sp.]
MDTKLKGNLSYHINITNNCGLVNNTALGRKMMVSSNNLVFCYLNNTLFLECVIQPEFINTPNLYTIFSKRSLENIPYLVSDLSKDLAEYSVCRQTINEETERNILDIRNNLNSAFDKKNKPIIIECSESSYYLILEGNKRITAMHMNKDVFFNPIQAYVGKTSLQWHCMLALHGMTAGRDSLHPGGWGEQAERVFNLPYRHNGRRGPSIRYSPIHPDRCCR